MITINNIYELQKIGNDPNYPMDDEYELSQDIDASDTVNWNSGAGFLPIGTSSKPFTGKFNGNGHKIRRLYINRSEENNVGLFGYVVGGEIRNLGIEEGCVVGRYGTGILVGYNRGIVRNCYSNGSVSGNDYVGGLVGYNRFGSVSSGTVSQSYSMGSVSGSGDYVGGLVGYNYGTVSESYSTGSVSGRTSVGGLVGRNYSGTVSQSYSTGSVSGSGDCVGGLVGENRGTVL